MTCRAFLRSIVLPFGVGVLSVVWALVAVHVGYPEWVVCLALPGTAWCQWKLAPFLWRPGGDVS